MVQESGLDSWFSPVRAGALQAGAPAHGADEASLWGSVWPL